MSLSLLNLATPLYSIHTLYNDAYRRYGEKIFINSVTDKEGIAIDYSDKNASKSVVSSLLVEMIDSIIRFQNARYDAYRKAQQEKSLLLKYLIPFILLVVVVGLLLSYLWIKSLFDQEKSAQVIDKVNYTGYLLMTVLGISLLISWAAIAYSRKVTAINAYNNTDFSSKLTLHPYLVNMINNVLPANTKGYVGSVTKQLSYPDILRALRKSIGLDEAHDSGVVAEEEAAKEDTHEDSKVKVIIIAHVCLVKGLISPEQYKEFESKCTWSGSILVPFSRIFTVSYMLRDPDSAIASTWHPMKLKRAIDLIDLSGQVQVLKLKMKYLSEFMLKEFDTDGDVGGNESTNKVEEYISGLTSVLTSVGTTSKKFSLRDPENYTSDNTVKDLQECADICGRDTKCEASYYNNANGTCYLVDGAAKSADKQDVLNYQSVDHKDCGMFIKDSSRNFVIATQYTDQPPPGVEGLKLTNTNASYDFPANSVCLVGDKERDMCQKQYGGDAGTPVPYWDLLKDQRKSSSIPSNINSTYTIKVTGDAIYKHEADGVSPVDQLSTAKEKYTRQVEYFMSVVDPTASTDLTNDILGRVSSNVAAYYMLSTANSAFKDLVESIVLNAQESQKKNIAAQSSTLTQKPGWNKYITQQRFEEKLKEMSQKKFIEEYLASCFDVYASSKGLDAIHQYYDCTPQIMDKTRAIDITIATLIGVVLFTVIVLFVVREFVPEGSNNTSKKLRSRYYSILEKENNNVSKNASASGTSRKILHEKIRYFTMWIGLVGSIFLALVFMISNQTRSRVKARFNYNVMKNNAATITQNTQQVVNTWFVDGLYMSRIVTSPMTFKEKNVDIFSYDSYVNNVTLSDSTKIDLANVDTASIYKRTVEYLEAYSKCNALLNGLDTNMPFPSYEISIYIVVCVLAIIVIVVLIYALDPFSKLAQIKHFKRLINQQTTSNIKMSLKDVPWSPEENEKLTSNLETVVTIAIPFILLAVIGLVGSDVLSGTVNFQNALESGYFALTNTCY